MKGRTRLIIGLVLVALGLGVAAMGLFEGESNVRYVEDMVERPAAHQRGTYTLMGVPQPELIPLTGSSGTILAENPDWSNFTRNTIAWRHGNLLYHSTHTLAVEAEGLATSWEFRNETHIAGDDALAFPVETATWSLEGRAFTVEAFNDGDGVSPRVWAIYDGPVKDAMQPKPSQFEGRLMKTLPDGTPLPAGALLYQVEEYTAGCSSKFLPAEEER